MSDGNNRGQEDQEGQDYAKGSAEDQQHDAPTGKEALTATDKDLPEDQLAFQTDSS